MCSVILASAVALLLHPVTLGTSHIIVFFSRNTKSNTAPKSEPPPDFYC
jgi:hypothetical protein